MTATFEIKNPDEIICSVTLEMSLGDWKDLKAQLCEQWPASRLSETISDLVFQVQKSFYSNHQKAS